MRTLYRKNCGTNKCHFQIQFKLVTITLALLLIAQISNASVNWNENDPWPIHGNSNPYDLTPNELAEANRAGRLHALHWPVDVTGALIPIRPFAIALEWVQSKLGLHSYPLSEGSGVYYVPFIDGRRPDYRMGFTPMLRDGAAGLTFSCAACHSGKIFGKTIIGLTNRFPGANSLFVTALSGIKKVSPEMLKKILGATDAEVEMYKKTIHHLRFVEAKEPTVKGLDTSLAHVALSLSHREADEFASLTNTHRDHPREEFLRHNIADSKPLVWWNVKYKNKWLADGSLVSGNPIFTNFIWNEIGRGTDLMDLENWFNENEDIIKNLTAAVYNTEAPRITDFFAASRIDLSKAQKGEVLFQNRCAQCHGQYIKAWSQGDAHKLSPSDLLKTVRIEYFTNTPIRNVGTDPNRRIGMKSLIQLNNLKISKENNILIKLQNGYVPPPLVGIWVRFPYLHNNSIPNLCELLKPERSRVPVYYSGEVINQNRDYDFNCGGYPVLHKTPPEWKSKAEHRYDTSMPGLSNRGHDFGFSELSGVERHNLIQFLLTL